MLSTEYIDDNDFSGCIKLTTSSARWKDLLLESKKKQKKDYDEKDYAFGIYQIQPIPPEKEKDRQNFLFDINIEKKQKEINKRSQTFGQ